MTPFLFEPGEEMAIEDITVENITIFADYPEQTGSQAYDLIRLRPTVNQYMKTKVPGTIKNIDFKNILLTGEEKEGWYPIWIIGADAEHMVSDVTFENITWFNHLLHENSPQVKFEENTKNIRFINSQSK